MTVEQAIVRIYNNQRRVVGTGFLVDKNRVITCAHVITEVLGLKTIQRNVLDQEIHLDFPLVKPDQLLPTRVIQIDEKGILDIAILELVNRLVQGAHPVDLLSSEPGSLWGHHFRAFGFPAGYEEGTWTSGLIRSITAKNWVQIEDEKQTGYWIMPGFSGSPVWDEQLNGVVGIIVSTEKRAEVKAAYMIPAEMLLKTWPRLQTAAKFPVTAFSIPENPLDHQTFQVNEQVEIQGTNYLIRERLAQEVADKFALYSFRASNLRMNQDAGICQVIRTGKQGEAQKEFEQLATRSKIYAQTAADCPHLQRVEVYPQGENVVWTVAEWISGVSLEKYFSTNAPLPDRSALIRLAGWLIDICEAIQGLHRRRLSPKAITARNIFTTPGRGAILVDPVYTSRPKGLPLFPKTFDATRDIQNFAEMIYQLVTRQPTSDRVASSINPAAPDVFDTLLKDALAGSIKNAGLFKRGLLETRRLLRSR